MGYDLRCVFILEDTQTMTLTDIKYIVEFCRASAVLAVANEVDSPACVLIGLPWTINFDFEEECLREVWIYSQQPSEIKGLCVWRNGINVNERYEYKEEHMTDG